MGDFRLRRFSSLRISGSRAGEKREASVSRKASTKKRGQSFALAMLQM
jgi:hypothetical protein